MATPHTPLKTPPNRCKRVFKKRIFPGNREDMAVPLLKRSRSSSFSLQDLLVHNFIRHHFSLKTLEKYERMLLSDISPLETNHRPEERLKNWMEENFGVDDEYAFTHEYRGLESLTSFLVTSNMRIDVAVIDKDDESILLLLLEVHSNKYDNTVAHCAIALIFQLRYIRLYDQEITEVSGFVFPSTKTEERISMITVRWENFLFHIEWECFNLEKANQMIHKVLAEQGKISKIVKNNKAKDYFMGLSQKDLSFLHESILPPDGSLEQVESAYSILVKNESYYYKICPNGQEREPLRGLVWKRRFLNAQSFPHLVLPSNIFDINADIPIFQFEAQPHQPLTRDEAIKCLKDFIQQAVTALEELHKMGFSHRDVRLPNFCFSKHYEAMLIDFDRAKGIDSSSLEDINFYEPPMNETEPFWGGLDFKQLGLMIHTIILPDKREEILDGEIKPSGPFLDSLISKGIYDKSLLDEFCEPYLPVLSIKEVISERP